MESKIKEHTRALKRLQENGDENLIQTGKSIDYSSWRGIILHPMEMASTFSDSSQPSLPDVIVGAGLVTDGS